MERPSADQPASEDALQRAARELAAYAEGHPITIASMKALIASGQGIPPDYIRRVHAPEGDVQIQFTLDVLLPTHTTRHLSVTLKSGRAPDALVDRLKPLFFPPSAQVTEIRLGVARQFLSLVQDATA